MYLMITVISNIDKLKPTLKALKSVGTKSNVAIDAIGTNNIDSSYLAYQSAIESALLSISQVAQYRKVILSIILDEEMFLKATDAVRKVLGNDLKKPNTGIMFTIPLNALYMKNAGTYENFTTNSSDVL